MIAKREPSMEAPGDGDRGGDSLTLPRPTLARTDAGHRDPSGDTLVGGDVTGNRVKSAFAVELRRALTRNGTTTRATAEAVGIHEGTLGELALGRHRPGLDVAARLAEVLGAPHLCALATEARTKRCRVCDRAFVDGTKHFGRRFCSQRCSKAAHARSQRKHYTHERLGQARLLQNRMEQMAEVIAAFCRDCTAGEGLCRDDECLLRPESPLPFIPLSRVSRRAA